MQTFLPVKSFVRSMEFLDVSRLGKQRIEATQILEILLQQNFFTKENQSAAPFQKNYGGFNRHPAVMMWVGHEQWLALYQNCCIGEWESRGYRNSIVRVPYDTKLQPPPPWLGYEPFHLSHRSNLLRKFPAHYRKFWPYDPSDLPYYWPTPMGGFSITKGVA